MIRQVVGRVSARRPTGSLAQRNERRASHTDYLYILYNDLSKSPKIIRSIEHDRATKPLGIMANPSFCDFLVERQRTCHCPSNQTAKESLTISAQHVSIPSHDCSRHTPCAVRSRNRSPLRNGKQSKMPNLVCKVIRRFTQTARICTSNHSRGKAGSPATGANATIQIF
jgi:hypothetical protein